VLPTNLISVSSLTNAFLPVVRPPYTVFNVDADVSTLINVKSGFTLSFKRQPVGPALMQIVNVVKTIFQAGEMLYYGHVIACSLASWTTVFLWETGTFVLQRSETLLYGEGNLNYFE
jgi:hypothetical protein